MTVEEEHEAFKNRLVEEVFASDAGDRKVPMEKVVMLFWQFRDDPTVITFMARFVAKVRCEVRRDFGGGPIGTTRASGGGGDCFVGIVVVVVFKCETPFVSQSILFFCLMGMWLVDVSIRIVCRIAGCL